MSQPTILKKFSSKSLLGNVRAQVNKGTLTDGQLLYKAIGIVDGVKHGVSQYGEWTCFLGDFLIIDKDGNRYTTSQAFFDSSFTSALESKLESVVSNSGDGVEFALECYISISDDYPMGFSYVTKPIVKDAVSRMSLLEDRLRDVLRLDSTKMMAIDIDKVREPAPETEPDTETEKKTQRHAKK